MQQATALFALSLSVTVVMLLTMHTDSTPKECKVMSANRMQAAVRTLDKTVLILFESDHTSVSGLQNGRLAVRLRRRVRRVKHLLQEGPEDEFWDELQKAILDAVKYARRVGC